MKTGSARAGGATASREKIARALCHGDLAAQCLLAVSNHGIVWIGLIALFAYGAGVLGPAFYISTHPPGSPYFLGLKPTDYRALPDEVLIDLVLTTIVWTLYAWQPRGIATMFVQLAKNDALTCEGLPYFDLEGFVEGNLPKEFKLPPGLIIPPKVAIPLVLVATYVGVKAGLAVYLNQNNPTLFGFRGVWWNQDWRYFLFWQVMAGIVVYMVIWIAWRHWAAVASNKRVIRSGELRRNPFDPDRCNGLAPIGRYAWGATVPTMLVGVVAAITIAYAILTFPSSLNADRGQWPSPPDTYAFVLLVPIAFDVVSLGYFLIYPMWDAHVEMCRLKREVLQEVSANMKHLLADNRMVALESSLARIRLLEAKYQIIDEQYATWPMHLPSVQAAGITSVITILTSLLPIVAQFIRPLPKSM
jgi:hypothetical protein